MMAHWTRGGSRAFPEVGGQDHLGRSIVAGARPDDDEPDSFSLNAGIPGN
jgi:hypothetical protein